MSETKEPLEEYIDLTEADFICTQIAATFTLSNHIINIANINHIQFYNKKAKDNEKYYCAKFTFNDGTFLTMRKSKHMKQTDEQFKEVIHKRIEEAIQKRKKEIVKIEK
jgi:hypothetical protein